MLRLFRLVRPLLTLFSTVHRRSDPQGDQGRKEFFIGGLKALREDILQVIAQIVFQVATSFELLAILCNRAVQLLIGTFLCIGIYSLERLAEEFDELIFEHEAAFEV